MDGRSSQSEGGKGGLTSNFLHVSSPAEFSFWYHMNGPGIGELSLSRMTQGGRLHELWSKHGRQGPDWNLARIMIPRGQYKVGDERVSKIFIVNIYWSEYLKV